MGSVRLPGKVMKPLAGKPMIQWIIERLQGCKKADVLILATTSLHQDDPLAVLAQGRGVEVFRGAGEDVLDRYYQCAQARGLDDIIRATGDNPFVDPEECDRLIDFYLERDLDYAAALAGEKGGFPIGVGTEIFHFSVLERSWKEACLPRHREHANEYILDHPELFKLGTMPAPPEKCAPEMSLTVDTADQFEFAEAVYAAYFKQKHGPWVPVEWIIHEYSGHRSPF